MTTYLGSITFFNNAGSNRIKNYHEGIVNAFSGEDAMDKIKKLYSNKINSLNILEIKAQEIKTLEGARTVFFVIT